MNEWHKFMSLVFCDNGMFMKCTFYCMSTCIYGKYTTSFVKKSRRKRSNFGLKVKQNTILCFQNFPYIKGIVIFTVNFLLFVMNVFNL